MQAAASSYRYASQLTGIGVIGIGVGQSGNPILSAVSVCGRCECFGAVGVRVVRSERPESEGERVLRCLNGVLCPHSPPSDGCYKQRTCCQSYLSDNTHIAHHTRYAHHFHHSHHSYHSHYSHHSYHFHHSHRTPSSTTSLANYLHL